MTCQPHEASITTKCANSREPGGVCYRHDGRNKRRYQLHPVLEAAAVNGETVVKVKRSGGSRFTCAKLSDKKSIWYGYRNSNAGHNENEQTSDVYSSKEQKGAKDS